MKVMRCFQIGVVLLWSTLAAHAAIPADQPLPTPTYGVNLGNTLEPPNGEGSWGPAATQSVIDTMAASGFNALRIPCAWDSHANQSTYQIDPVFMARVKEVVDWAIAAGLYVVVNDHWDGGWMENNLTTSVDSVINAKMQSYWTQIATEFAGYDNHLVFAAANEPSVASPEVMNTLQVYYQTFVDAVRGVGGNNTNRWLVLQSVSEPSWMDTLPADPTPNRMMVEYHQYTPSLFTIIHTDQTWGNAMYYWGAAYHYSADPTRNATWGEEDEIDAFYQQLHDQYISKDIPVMIGEFGAWTASLSGTAATWNRNSTLYWNKYAAESARAHGISPFFWTIQSDVFDWTTGAVLDPDVVNVLTDGAAPPPPNGAPYAVTGLTATTAGTGQIGLSWNAAIGATSYSLYRAGVSGDECALAPVVTGITGTSYTDTGLNDGTTYYYQVVAVNGSGSSGFTAEAHATTPGTNPDPAQYNFETDTQGWEAGGSPISGVAASAAQSYAGNQSLAVNFNGTKRGTSTVSLAGAVVPAWATVTFRVWAPSGHKISSVVPWIQDANWSSWTGSGYSLTANAWNAVTMTVPANLSAPFLHFGLEFSTSGGWTGTCYIDSISWNIPTPVAPTGLVATSSGSTASLSWGWVSAADSYTVKRSTTSGSGYATVATGVTGLNYQDTGLVNGTTYYYVVEAVNASGASANSPEASATGGTIVVPAPTGLAAVPVDAQVSLSWDTSAGADSYVVKRSTASGAPYETVVSNIVSTNYTDTDVTNGTTYYYVVSAVQSAVESANSLEVHTTPVPFHFESGVQGWVGGGGIVSGVATSTAQAYAGNQSLAVNFNGTASGTASPHVNNVAVVPGSTITFHVWIPGGSQITALQPFIQDKNYAWTSSWYGSFTADAWNTLSLTVPANAVSPLSVLGVQVITGGAWTGTCYIDSVYVESPPQAPASPTGLAAVAGDGSVDLSWSAASGATGYKIKRSTTSGSGYAAIATINSLALADSGLANGTLYYYVVSATNGVGESADSAEVSVRPLASEPAPLNVVMTNNQIEISWPADHTGWGLEYTTNLMDTNGWTLVPSSDATNMLNWGSLTNGSIYYRLVYP